MTSGQVDYAFLNPYVDYMISGLDQFNAQKGKVDMAVLYNIEMMEANECMSPSVTVPSPTVQAQSPCDAAVPINTLQPTMGYNEEVNRDGYQELNPVQMQFPYEQPAQQQFYSYNYDAAQYYPSENYVAYEYQSIPAQTVVQHTDVSSFAAPVDMTQFRYPTDEDVCQDAPVSVPPADFDIKTIKLCNNQPPIRYKSVKVRGLGSRAPLPRQARGFTNYGDDEDNHVPDCDAPVYASRRPRGPPPKSGGLTSVQKHRRKEKEFLASAPETIKKLQQMISVVNQTTHELQEFERIMTEATSYDVPVYNGY